MKHFFWFCFVFTYHSQVLRVYVCCIRFMNMNTLLTNHPPDLCLYLRLKYLDITLAGSMCIILFMYVCKYCLDMSKVLGMDVLFMAPNIFFVI